MSERGEHRAIYTVLLQSPEFLELSPDGQLVWFHLKLMLGPAGIDVIPAAEAQLEETTGMGSERVRDGISDAIEVGLLRRERNVLWIPNGLRFEPSRSLENENHVKSIVRHIGGLPKLAIVNDFAEYYGLEPPFPELCPAGCPSDGIPDHGKRRTENGKRKTETLSTPREAHPVFGSLEELTIRSLKGLYGWAAEGIEGTDEAVWPDGVVGDQRERCLQIAVQRLEGEGKSYNGRLFRRILETVIREQTGPRKADPVDTKASKRRRRSPLPDPEVSHA